MSERYEVPPERLARWLAADGPVVRTKIAAERVRFVAARELVALPPFPPLEPGEHEGFVSAGSRGRAGPTRCP